MRIAYVLPRPELCGGIKVAFQHAGLLRSLGHQVSVLGEGRRPLWASYWGRYVDLRSRGGRLPSQDLLIATFWTTVPLAERLDAGPVVHFCQGFEGSAAHLRAWASQIDEVYRRPYPAFVVSPHLGDLLAARFGKASRVVPPPLDARFRPGRREASSQPPWVAILGLYEAAVKNVVTALEAVRRLRNAGHACRVLRISPLPLSAEEQHILAPDRYLRQVWPGTVARHLRRCRLLLFSSRAEEGFGLPLLEAMASGVPAVASAIPSARFLSGGAVPLVPATDSAAFAEAAAKLLTDPVYWKQVSEAGRVAAQRFAAGQVAQELQAALEWARCLVTGVRA